MLAGKAGIVKAGMGAGKARGMDDIIYCDVILLFMYKK